MILVRKSHGLAGALVRYPTAFALQFIHGIRCTASSRSSSSAPTGPNNTQPSHAHDLFHYTSGRWIFNEPHRIAERYLPFDISQLKRIAAESTGRGESEVSSIRKQAEGGFNRTFEVTMRDGFQVIAKMPYPSTIPKHYTVASEVATMDFLRLHGLPIPHIFHYSASDKNPLGVEYVIMEKVAGKELGDIWYDMPEKQRLKMIIEVTKMEALLFSIRLPASGSIYYKHDLAANIAQVDIEIAGTAGKFCIGPDAQYKWWYKERSSLSIDRGPFSSAQDAMQSVAKRELTWMEKYARPRFPIEPLYREIYGNQKVSPAEHIRNLSDYLRIADLIVPEAGSALARPVVRHPDLQPNNIFLSDSCDIVGLIDWQHCSVRPLFLQAGPPKHFQNYGDDDSENFIMPRPPENFAELGEQEQEAAKELFRRRQLHYYYFAATAKYNEEHFDACMDDDIVSKQKLFQHAGNPWEGDNVTLKADLIRATKNWRDLTRTSERKDPDCPLGYSPAEVEECLRMESEQREADDDMETLRRCLGINVEGWVPVEHYEDAKALNANFKAQAVDGAETEDLKALIRETWAFDDHGEDE